MNPNVQGSIPTLEGFLEPYERLLFENDKLFLFSKIIYYGQFIALSKKNSPKQPFYQLCFGIVNFVLKNNMFNQTNFKVVPVIEAILFNLSESQWEEQLRP